MPLPNQALRLEVFSINVALHFKLALTAYMFIKGIRWGTRNNLSLVLVIALLFAAVQAAMQSFLLAQVVLNCWAHMQGMYAVYAVYVLLLDCVLYYRAWCVSPTKPKIQAAVSVFMTLGHFAVLVVDAAYTISFLVDIPEFGCLVVPGWTRALFGIFSTVNDIVQVAMFCVPLIRAAKNISGIRQDATPYRRMIVKSVVCLTVCTLSNVAYSVLVYTNEQFVSLIFSDVSLLFQILSACEIQFNSHRETEKASLGAIMYQTPLDLRRKLPDTSMTVAQASVSEQTQSISRVV